MSLTDIFVYLRAHFPTVRDFHQNTTQLIQRDLPPRGSRFHLDIPQYCLYIERSKNANVVVYQAQFSKTSDNAEKDLENSSEQRESMVASSDEKDEAKHGKKKKGPSNNNEKNKSIETVFRSSDTLHPLWIKLEPEHVERRRQRGEVDDYTELNLVEKKLAYGCSSEAISFSDFCDHFFASPLGKDEKRAKKGKHMSKRVLTAEEEEGAREWWKSLEPHHVKFVAASSLPVVLILCRDPSEESTSPPLPVLLTVLKGSTVCILEHLYVRSIEPKHFYELPKVEYVDFFGYVLGRCDSAITEKENTKKDSGDATNLTSDAAAYTPGMLLEERRKG